MAKSSTITKTLRNAQKAISSYIKPGRRKAAATIDDIIDMLHEARVGLANQVTRASAKKPRPKAKKQKSGTARKVKTKVVAAKRAVKAVKKKAVKRRA